MVLHSGHVRLSDKDDGVEFPIDSQAHAMY